MIKSMTGFGRAEVIDEERKVTVEMKSVNHRYLDINIRMPMQIFSLIHRFLIWIQFPVIIIKKYIQKKQKSLVCSNRIIPIIQIKSHFS